MAERDCRTVGQQRSPGASRSRDRSEREAPAESSRRVCQLLQHRPGSHAAAGFPDGPTRRAPAVTGGKDCRVSPSRWPSSSLRVAGSSLIREPIDSRNRSNTLRANNEDRHGLSCRLYAEPERGSESRHRKELCDDRSRSRGRLAAMARREPARRSPLFRLKIRRKQSIREADSLLH
jgi:hypothetical protein